MNHLDQESRAFGPLQVDIGATESYEQLQRHASIIADDCGVASGMRGMTMHLLDGLQAQDEKTAKESLQTLPLAIQVGRVIGDFYGIDPPLEHLWSAALLHDIGKRDIPRRVIRKSNEGLEWTADDRKVMSKHPLLGGFIVRTSGFPELVVRPVEEHHHKQLGSPSYGRDARLNDPERLIRDSIAVGDFADAMMSRTNTRNARMDRAQRIVAISANIRFVFDDYTHPDALADRIISELVSETPPQDQPLPAAA